MARTTLLLISALMFSLPLCGPAFDRLSDRAPVWADAHNAAAQRFAIKYCYNQYRFQADVTRCLGSGAF